MTGLAVGPATGSDPPMLEGRPARRGRNTRLLADRAGELMAVVRADGFGHGALDVARTALGAAPPASASPRWRPGRCAAGLVAPVLSWLNPVDADFATAVARRIDLAVPAPGTWRRSPRSQGRAGAPRRRRDGARRAEPASWEPCAARPVVPELRGRVEVVGVMGHLGCADDPTDSCNAWPVPVSRGPGDRTRHRPRPATGTWPRRPRPSPTRGPTTMSRVGAGSGRDRPVAYHHRAAPGDDAHRSPGVGAPGPRRYPVATATHRTATATHLGGLVPSATPTGSPPGVPTGPRCRCAASDGRSSGCSRWTSSWSTSGSAGRAGETVTVFGPGGAGEPTSRRWAAWGGTIGDVVTGIGARVAPAPDRDPHLRSLA